MDPLDITEQLEASYRQFGFRIHGRALRILGRREDAADVVQAVFMQLAKSLKAGDPPRSVERWIYIVATREALQLIRRRKRRRAREAEYSSLEALSSPSGEARSAATEQVLRLVDAVAPEELESALLYFVDGLSQGEIGGLLGVSRRTIIRRVNRFRAAAEKQRATASEELA